MTPLKHGTLTTYSHHGCRCDECRQARYEYMREWRRRALEAPLPAYVQHGSKYTYSMYACRCEECGDAKAASDKAYREARKAAQ